MLYKLDASGYVLAVAFGCYLEDSTEYNGEIPSGYKSLDDWASYGCIQAYYIDVDGNLVLDFERKLEIENKQEQEAIDNSPVLRKDIFDTEEAIEGQYIREIASGKVIVLKDIKTIAPKVKITGIQQGYDKLRIYAHGKNMMPCHAESCVISGVTFTKNASGSLTILGTSTEPIEYVIADGKDTTLFALKSNEDYYLNLGGLQCELSYFDGETTAQQYIGASGLLNLPEHIEVTKVVIKIPSGESLNTTFYPQLEYGKAFTGYDSHKLKALEINIGELEKELVIPKDDLHPDDELYPGTYPNNIDYILVENGKVSVSIDNKVKISQSGSMGLFSKYNTIYATKDVDLEVEYSANFLLVDSLAFLQGKATTSEKFIIKKDGSIQATNGYFKGKIEADSGYFKGVVEFEKLKDENGKEIDEIVTTLTRTTVTTQYVNSLGVTAGYVSAENIIGDTIYGKTLSGGTVYGSKITGGTISGSSISAGTITGGTISGASISGGTLSGSTISGGSIKIGSYFSVNAYGEVIANSLISNDAQITGGTIGGFIIDGQGIKSGKTSLSDTRSGVYVGSDGISVGRGFRVDYDGDVTLGTLSELKVGGAVDVYYSYNYRTRIEENRIIFGNANPQPQIRVGDQTLITLTSSSVGLNKDATIGGTSTSCKVGFFGKDGTTQQRVTTLTTGTQNASNVADKLNELIKVLQDYGLIKSY